MTREAAYYPGGSNPAAPVSILGSDPASIPFTIQGAPGQASDLFLVRAGSGATVTRVTAGGDLFSNGHMIGGTYIRGGTVFSNFTDVTPFRVAGNDAIHATAQVVAFAGQSANVQEWQNSGGTPVAIVQAAGNIKGNNVSTFNSAIQMAEGNGGGHLILNQSSAGAGAQSAGTANIYVRPGSASGVKLVAIGPNGVETTILDNL